jgi:hypothetical protein
MTTVAETVDAVSGTGTRRDSHEAVIADPAGTPVMTMRIGNDSAGFTRLLAAIAEVVPGPRVAVCIEGSRSYGIGLARALAAAGLLVLECEQPSRKQRRGKGKSGPVDAHLAVLAALRLDAAGGRCRAPAVTGRRCGSCWLPGRRSRWPAPRRPAGYVPCCWPVTTPAAAPPARPCPARPPPRWPAARSLLRPAASRPSARPRAAA